MRAFAFVTTYCAILVFLLLYIMVFVALAAGSAPGAVLFGFSAIVVASVRDDINGWMRER